jgi:hypothetical protein
MKDNQQDQQCEQVLPHCLRIVDPEDRELVEGVA